MVELGTILAGTSKDIAIVIIFDADATTSKQSSSRPKPNGPKC
ncbi:MAG: hypothetical protein QXK93_05300 [Candidatus Bathyarchaeia archaeon]